MLSHHQQHKHVHNSGGGIEQGTFAYIPNSKWNVLTSFFSSFQFSDFIFVANNFSNRVACVKINVSRKIWESCSLFGQCFQGFNKWSRWLLLLHFMKSNRKKCTKWVFFEKASHLLEWQFVCRSTDYWLDISNEIESFIT